ncbi:MAG TPA: AmmeMemoRadiSam system protein B [Candidatus Krumholzibacteria bacterium]|nr:AmmeMemoRadiSam system protein B [Candidatus Krumholzibacteria bacterium]HRX51270.1 AmmeMemoRadiSam system protein B [Candidatus Krumholzibacteria bacterium]
MPDLHVRPAALAGQWYPAAPDALRRSVAMFLAAADPAAAPPGKPVLAVVPHAGHAWSGAVAGHAYGLLRGHAYRRVLLLAPNHRHRLAGPSASPADAYATPLGLVPLDVDGRARLEAAGVLTSVPAAHAHEHAEEIQLPFLQALWDDVPPVLPLLVPTLDDARRAALAAALAPWTDGESLVIVSTDFTHYGADFGYLPFRDRVPERLADLDRGALDLLCAGDAAGLLAYRARTGITMCGLDAAALALSLPWPRPPRLRLLDYARSGDRDGDFVHSVSYAALLGAAEAAA